MTKPARRAFRSMNGTVLVTVLAAACPLLSGAALANTAGSYLNWQNKAPASAPAPAASEIHTTSGTYPVPASPYGQVGDPYAKSLSWPAKGGQASVQVAPQVASVSPPPQTPVPQQPVYEPAPVPAQTAPMPSVAVPVPLPAPQPVPVVRVPAPVASNHTPIQPQPAVVAAPPVDYSSDPGYADDPGLSDDDPAMASIAPVVAPPAPKPAPAPVAPKPEPKPEPVVAAAPPPKPAPAPVAPQPAPKPDPAPPAVAAAVNSDGGYQVPATSKYAARIEASRAAQQAEVAAAAPVQAAAKPAPKAPEKPEAVATAPEPQVSLASQETDHVFIPGEQIRSAADEPRVYSLHRQYGLRPDPITVTPNATGGLLTVDAVEGGDPNDDTPTDDTKLN